MLHCPGKIKYLSSSCEKGTTYLSIEGVQEGRKMKAHIWSKNKWKYEGGDMGWTLLIGLGEKWHSCIHEDWRKETIDHYSSFRIQKNYTQELKFGSSFNILPQIFRMERLDICKICKILPLITLPLPTFIVWASRVH